MTHLRIVADDRFPTEAMQRPLRGASLLEIRTTSQSSMGRLLEWFHPGLVAVLDVTRSSRRCSPAEALAGHDESSFDAVFGLGALRTRRLLDALSPAALVRAIRPGGLIVLSDFAPGSGEMWRHGALLDSDAPQLLEWIHRFDGLGLSWLQNHRAYADAGRLLIAQLPEHRAPHAEARS